MDRRSTRRPWLVRSLSVLAVVVCLGAQLGSFAHFALVSHVRCAEHGELVHGEPGAPSGSPHAEGHEHCVLAAHHAAPIQVETARVTAAPPPPRAAERPAPRPAPPPAPIAIVFFAPKHSPPA